MRYISTRSNTNAPASFKDTLFNGLASDGGLFIPENIPFIDLLELEKKINADSKPFTKFIEIAFSVSRLYIDKTEIPDDDLKNIMVRSFSTFRSSLVTPLVKINLKDENLAPLYVLELFHGPTFAFKDIALQVLGNLFEYFLLKERDRKITVICATSGDTGGAAIYSVMGKQNIECYVLHPKDKISNIQKAQMTTIMESNIHNIEINGTFDDCQTVVKNLFKDTEFKDVTNLTTFNSINWCRIMVQITYYFYAYFQLKNSEKNITLDKLQFSVPTGNFGDILAGFYAKKMGLPIHKLIIATNKNDILYRFIKEDGLYFPIKTVETLSPAMDISISSNFERLLWYFRENDTNISNLMDNLIQNGFFNVSKNSLNEIKKIFSCERVNDIEIIDTIRQIMNEGSYLIDPHTAVGVCSFIKNEDHKQNISIALSTAHPGKFPEVINQILSTEEKDNFVPEILKNSLFLEQKYESIDIDKNLLSNIKNYILRKKRR